MEIDNIDVKNTIFSLDIGTRAIKGTVGIVKDKKFCVLAESYFEHEERAMMDGQIHDINLVSYAVNNVKKDLESKISFKLKDVSIAAAGRFLKTSVAKAEFELEEDKEIDKDIVRSLELTAVKLSEGQINKEQLENLYCVGYSVMNYYLNGYHITNLLSHKGENISAEVIATFLPRSVVDSLYAVMKKVGLNVVSLTLEPIAAMEAVIPQNLRLLNLALVDIGAGTSDIAITDKDSICAYGMIPMAGDEITEAIAQRYLVDFNTAEQIKKQCVTQEKVKYIDVIGFENEVNSSEIINAVNPLVEKLGKAIADKIAELNGGKSPNAVFMVGGGAYTPKLKEVIAKELNLPEQRLAIKGREAITSCVGFDNSLGSIGVTVLGIALVSIKKLGHDFINVNFNGTVISLFNAQKHKVMDVLLQAGINPKTLIARNGKTLRFTLNDTNRIVFGELGKNAVIRKNNEVCSIDTEVNEGDNIDIEFAVDGQDARAKVKEIMSKVYSIGFYLNDELCNLEPLAKINNEIRNLDDYISEDDKVEIIYPQSIKDFKLYYNKENCKFKMNNTELEEDYLIKEGDKIYIEEIQETKVLNNDNTQALEEVAADVEEVSEKIKNEEENSINITINGKAATLNGKKEYVFIDVFSFIDFDRTKASGSLILLLNGNRANYMDKLKEGDNVIVKWE